MVVAVSNYWERASLALAHSCENLFSIGAFLSPGNLGSQNPRCSPLVHYCNTQSNLLDLCSRCNQGRHSPMLALRKKDSSLAVVENRSLFIF